MKKRKDVGDNDYIELIIMLIVVMLIMFLVFKYMFTAIVLYNGLGR